MIKKKDVVKALERDAAMKFSANDYDEVPSEEVRKIHALFEKPAHQKQISRPSFIIGRIAIVLTCIFIIGCVSVYAFPIMLDARLDHAISQKDSVIGFNTPDGNLVVPDTELLLPTYIPEGYTANTYGVEPPYSVLFQNNDNQTISLIQSTDDTGGVLSNTGDIVSVQVHGEAAEFLDRKEGGSRLLWMYGGFYFTLDASALSKEEMVKIAESIMKEKE